MSRDFDTVQVKLRVADDKADGVWINGMKIRGLRNVSIDASYNTATEITISFLANIESISDAPRRKLKKLKLKRKSAY